MHKNKEDVPEDFGRLKNKEDVPDAFESRRKDRKSVIVMILSFAALFVFGICLIRAVVISGQDQETLVRGDSTGYDSMESWNEGWTLEVNGKVTENITLPCTISASSGDEVKITMSLQEEDTPEVIEFDNLRQAILVTSDQGDLCRVNMTKIAKGMVFTDLQIVEIPKNARITELSLVFKTGTDGTCSLPTIRRGSMAAARYEILDQDLFSLVLLSLFALLTIILVITGIFFAAKKKNDTRIWVLAAFLLLLFLWGTADSYLPVMFLIPQEVLGILEYMPLMAMPVPIGVFVWLSYEKKSRTVPVFVILSTLNLILQGIFSIYGVILLNKTFWISHILILLTVGFSLGSVIKAQKSVALTAENTIIFAACVILGFTSVSAVFSYWLADGTLYRLVMLTGTFTFVCALFAAVVSHSMRLHRQEEIRLSELKISERLSRYDQLTGLLNRRAYEEKIEEIDAGWTGDAVMVMMDVNGLKKTNDTYGHAAGDDLIISAAKTIEEVYKTEGCYRIGGDEFVVILLDLSKDMVSYDKELEEAIEKVNQGNRWKLSIARGASHLINSNGIRLTVSDWKMEADVNMYQHKISFSIGEYRDKAKDLSDIIDCIITTLEAKDPYTAYHSDRVRELSVCIGKKLGLSASTMNNLETAAHMHDIGKVGVPDRVLTKPGRLTDEEYALMKRHSAIGADILSKAKGMKEISLIVLHHHERYDGKGYPDGIAGDEIPLESRIIAIADSIDAMTSKRIYRDAMSIDYCRSEIEKNQGVMYDPAISKIVLDHWTEIQDIILLHPKRL